MWKFTIFISTRCSYHAGGVNIIQASHEPSKNSTTVGFKFVDLEVPNVTIVVLTYSEFENASVIRSQLVFRVLMGDPYRASDMANYNKTRWKLVTVSIM